MRLSKRDSRHYTAAGGVAESVTHGPGPEGSLRVSVSYRLTPGGDTKAGALGVDVELVHDVRADSTVDVSVVAAASSSLPPFPRAGLRMRCPSDMAGVTSSTPFERLHH